jgi:hypothetical protein
MHIVLGQQEFTWCIFEVHKLLDGHVGYWSHNVHSFYSEETFVQKKGGDA